MGGKKMFSTPDRSVALAAQAIIDLINSRPISPRQDEIAAIIKSAVAAPLSRTSDRTAMRDEKALDEEYGPIVSARG